ncbi:permease-like cell division protein FtsX [Nonomuraea sp. NPDC046570]|uniref:permease-like cell division protein FtsX n=1 Tax=Nonomuraea sp. NPDC046570 TaxID=3155255 RepID=UPI0033D3A7C2
MRRVLLVAGMAVVTTVAAAGSGFAGERGGPLPPPKAPWPTEGIFSVYLCKGDGSSKACGNKGITPAQRRAAGARMRAMPEVKSLRFVSRDEALTRLHITLDDSAAEQVVKTELRKMPGADSVSAGSSN